MTWKTCGHGSNHAVANRHRKRRAHDMAPPDMWRAAPAFAGSGPLKADLRLGGAIEEQDKPNGADHQAGVNVASTAEIIEATERAEDLICLWREHRRLAHRVRLA